MKLCPVVMRFAVGCVELSVSVTEDEADAISQVLPPKTLFFKIGIGHKAEVNAVECLSICKGMTTAPGSSWGGAQSWQTQGIKLQLKCSA